MLSSKALETIADICSELDHLLIAERLHMAPEDRRNITRTIESLEQLLVEKEE